MKMVFLVAKVISCSIVGAFYFGMGVILTLIYYNNTFNLPYTFDVKIALFVIVVTIIFTWRELARGIKYANSVDEVLK